LKCANAALQFKGDFVRILVGRESDRHANCGSHVPGSRQDSLALFQIKKSMQIDWNNGNVQLFREQAGCPNEKEIISPSSVVLPSGKTNTFQRRSARSPAKAKLRRKPDCCGSGKH